MTRFWLCAAPLALLAAVPAQATGGMICRSAAGEISLTISHSAASAIVGARLSAGGRTVPISIAQSWIDRSEIRLDLTDPNAMRVAARLRAKRIGKVYEGALARRGHTPRWVRCRED